MATTLENDAPATTKKSRSRSGTASPRASSGTAKSSRATSASASRSGSKAARSRGFSQGALLGAAAAGLLAGLIATIGRKAAMQAASARSGDWMEALKNEHQATLKIFEKIEATSNTQTTKRAFLLMQLKHALSKHAFEEENVIYPALRANAERDEADHLTHDHGYVKQYIYDLEHTPRSSQAWLDKAREFRATLTTHIREEEETIFPQLHARLGNDDNAALTSAMNKEGFKLA